MAENKKSFLLYTDLLATVKKLPPEVAGKLFLTILEYVNDLNPDVTSDYVLDLVFGPIRLQLKRDLEKYDKIRDRNRINGSKSKGPKKEIGLDESTQKNPVGSKDNPKVTDNDSVTDNVIVNDNVNNNKVSKPDKSGLDFEELLGFINKYTGRNFQKMNEKVKAKYRARVKEGYTKAQIGNAIMVASQMKYHKENNYQYLTPDFFSRADKLDMYGTSPGKATTESSFTPKTESYAK